MKITIIDGIIYDYDSLVDIREWKKFSIFEENANQFIKYELIDGSIVIRKIKNN